MQDLISRQAAIETIRKLPNAGIHWFVSAEAVFDALLKLPSAQSSLKEAVSVIRDFLNRGEFIATSTFKTEDGKILKTDWGYFEDGLNTIERCTGENL